MKSRKLSKVRLPSSSLRKVYRDLFKAHGHLSWWPAKTPFEVMVGAILTQNTAWTNVEKAIKNLNHAGVLTPVGILSISKAKLAQLIRPAGYFNVKADRLRCFVSFYRDEYGASIQRMKQENADVLRKKLLAVKGIGEETADCILLYAAEKISFVIDAYTRRIFSRHGLSPRSDDYASWKKLFESALDHDLDLYGDFHAQIVETGKRYCLKTAPRCEVCPLNRYL